MIGLTMHNKIKKITQYSKSSGPSLGMTIFPRPAWPAPPHFAPCGFSLSRKGGGARMGQDFRPAPWGGAGMGLHFLDPPRPASPHPRPAPH